MFSASRNNVSSSSVVGKTLNSAGRTMYMATIITTTDSMMSVTMRMSSTKGGRGVIRVTTIARTASGTASSRKPRPDSRGRPFQGAGAAMLFVISTLVTSAYDAGSRPFMRRNMYARTSATAL